MSVERRPLGLWFAWFVTKLSPLFFALFLVVVVGISWIADRRFGMLFGMLGLALLGFVVVYSWKFAYVLADDSGLYVQRLWKTEFVPWHGVSDFYFNFRHHPCLVIHLKRPLGGTRDVLIDSVPPFNPSVTLWVRFALGRAEPEIVTWFRQHLESAQKTGVDAAG